MELKQFNELVKDIFELKERKKILETEVKDINSIIREKETTVMAYLAENDLTRFDSSSGLVSQTVKLNVKKVDEDALKEYLISKGDYDSMAKINTMTLTAYIKAEKDRSDDVIFEVPGLELSEYIKLSYRTK